MKQIIKRICLWIVELAEQHRREQDHMRYSVPASASIGKVTLQGTVTIGEHTYINEYSCIDSGTNSRVTIGKYCAIGRYVHITSKTHGLEQPTADESHSFHAMVENDVRIGDYVWIGDKVLVFPGVTIGDYAVIAAHSIVKKDVLPFEIVGGAPARHIRFNDKHYRYSTRTPNV